MSQYNPPDPLPPPLPIFNEINWQVPDVGTGTQGRQGLPGVNGPQGFQGAQGAQGFQGNDGNGFQGFQGYQGAQGNDGNGFQGFQGYQGYQGALNQQNDPIFIGAGAGATAQQLGAIAIGVQGGMFFQGVQSIAIGFQAGYTGQNFNSVAIGRLAGQTNQRPQCVAIGPQAGFTGQGRVGNNAVAIGTQAGYSWQGAATVAIGAQAGSYNQTIGAVAIGVESGVQDQGQQAVAIGANSGEYNQGNFTVAIGNLAGSTSQGNYAVAIGHNAGVNNQPSNSIVLNASSSALNGATANAFYVKPIRGVTGLGATGSNFGGTGTFMATYTPSRFEINYTPFGVACMLFKSTESVAQGTSYVPITFDSGTTLYDTNGFHSEVTNNTRITPTIPGLYCFSISSATVNNTTGIRSLRIFENGSTSYVAFSAPVSATTVQQGYSGSFVTMANGTTDYYEMEVRHVTGGTLDWVNSRFSCFLVRPL